jgi:acyl-CoA thioester hydrolase
MQDYPFYKEFKIHWGEVDSLGHVNHTRYLVWFETVRCQFMMELGIEVQGDADIGPILANLNVNYHAPLYFPDTVTVGVRISKIGNSSFVLEYAATRTQDPSKIVCDASTVLVLFNYKKHCKELIYDELKQKMLNYFHT